MPVFAWTGFTGTAIPPPFMTELPPILPIFSMIKTLFPFLAALRPAASPANPEPMMTTSYSSSNLTSFASMAEACAFTAPKAKAPAPATLILSISRLEICFIRSPFG